MSQIFKEIPKRSPGFLQKLMKKEPVENAFVELNNLLARRDLKDISHSDIQAISVKYKVDFYKKFSNKIKDLYRTLLTSCLTDNKLTTEELEELKKLKTFLSLKDKDIEDIHNLVAGQIYKKSFSQVIKD